MADVVRLMLPSRAPTHLEAPIVEEGKEDDDEEEQEEVRLSVIGRKWFCSVMVIR